MNEQENNVHIDHQGIIQQITDKVITDFMAALMPDDKSRKLWTGLIAIHRKHGIDALTSIKIIQEFADFAKELEN